MTTDLLGDRDGIPLSADNLKRVKHISPVPTVAAVQLYFDDLPMTMNELHSRLGGSRVTIYNNFIHAKKDPAQKTMELMCQALGLSMHMYKDGKHLSASDTESVACHRVQVLSYFESVRILQLAFDEDPRSAVDFAKDCGLARNAIYDLLVYARFDPVHYVVCMIAEALEIDILVHKGDENGPILRLK